MMTKQDRLKRLKTDVRALRRTTGVFPTDRFPLNDTKGVL